MKRLLWLLPLFIFCGLNAQTSPQSFIIINSGSASDITAYEHALTQNDLDKYRHIDHRTVMHFTNGLEVELLSGTEMQTLRLPVDMDKVNATNIDRLKNSQFTLHSSGRIIELVTPVTK